MFEEYDAGLALLKKINRSRTYRAIRLWAAHSDVPVGSRTVAERNENIRWLFIDDLREQKGHVSLFDHRHLSSMLRYIMKDLVRRKDRPIKMQLLEIADELMSALKFVVKYGCDPEQLPMSSPGTAFTLSYLEQFLDDRDLGPYNREETDTLHGKE